MVAVALAVDVLYQEGLPNSKGQMVYFFRNVKWRWINVLFGAIARRRRHPPATPSSNTLLLLWPESILHANTYYYLFFSPYSTSRPYPRPGPNPAAGRRHPSLLEIV